MALPIMYWAPAFFVGTLVISTPLILLVIGLFFAIMLRKQETGPNAHGLETITTSGSKE